MIDDKIDRLKRLQEENESQSMAVWRLVEKFRLEVENSKKEIRLISEQLFENNDFIIKLKKHIYSIVEREIASQLSENGIHSIIKKILRDKIKDELWEKMEIYFHSIIHDMLSDFESEVCTEIEGAFGNKLSQFNKDEAVKR